MPNDRPIVLIIASILIIINAILGILVFLGLLLVGALVSFVSQSASSIGNLDPQVKALLSLGSIGSALIIVFAFVYLLWIIADLIAGYGLWKQKKYGGIIGLASSILGLLAAIIFTLIGIPDILGFLMNISLILLIAFGWKYLN